LNAVASPAVSDAVFITRTPWRPSISPTDADTSSPSAETSRSYAFLRTGHE
jgi:hypothetical protein